MRVTAIKKQIKNDARFSIFVDGEYVFSFSENGLLNSGLKIGLELDAEQVEALKKESDTDRLTAKVLNLLARRPRSKWEIEQYLKRKTNNKEEIEKILNALSKYIDDEDFAQRWVDNRRLLKFVSKRKLELELRQKRIDNTIIQHVLGQDETDDYNVLKELIERKRSQARYQDDLKLAQYLHRQGFRYEDIKRALSEFSQLD